MLKRKTLLYNPALTNALRDDPAAHFCKYLQVRQFIPADEIVKRKKKEKPTPEAFCPQHITEWL